jgi:hypothetical protein
MAERSLIKTAWSNWSLSARPLRLSGEWHDGDYDVLADGTVVGRIMEEQAGRRSARRGCGRSPLGNHEDRTPSHGYAATREAAMAAFAKSWRRES